MSSSTDKNCIMIIDDDYINRELLKNIFSLQYTFEEAANGKEGLAKIQEHKDKLCAIILDIEMPEMTGTELLEIISELGITEAIPTFIITGHDDDELVEAAYGYGVMDVISKPVTAIVIQKRVKTVVELFNTRDRLNAIVQGQRLELFENAKSMDNLQRGTLEALATAIEFRDTSSGQHVNRIYGMTKLILSKTDFGLGLSAAEIEDIARGSIMHDVGKIAISDIILNKPGKLTTEEFEIMKLHTVKGAELMSEISNIQHHQSYTYACDIARHHHERYDGKGYPDGLSGDEISVAAQVVSIVDVYDALVSDRVYKKAFTNDVATDMIKTGKCGTFNPKLVRCFLEVEPVIRCWYESDIQDDVLSELNNDNIMTNTSYSSASTAEATAPDTVLDVMLMTAAMQTAYDMIISVNLSQNKYHMVDYDNFLTHCAETEGVFDDLIEYGSASVPVSHRKEFHDTFCRENLLKIFSEGKRNIHLEHPQYSDDGKLHWVVTRVLFMEDTRTGDILQITLSRYIDDEYKEKQKTRKVLADALNLAEQANNAKVDFLSKLSHDIRTPLNAIIGMTAIIAADVDNKQKIEDCLVKIGVSSRHLLDIVNDVLDYSKLQNGNLAIHKADFDLRDLLAELSNDISLLTASKQQSFTLNLSENMASGYIGDEFRIRQILINLLDNAHKYTDAGGNISLDVSVSRHSDEYDLITFVVKDNGKGIRKEFMHKLFDPFMQEDVPVTSDSIGLGLAISRNLSHLMNGDLSAFSTFGEGSVFTFELPLEKGVITSSSEANLPAAIACSEKIIKDKTCIRFNGERILLAEDNDFNAEVAKSLLEMKNLTVDIANNGKEAYEMFISSAPGEYLAIFMDIIMPKMDGHEATRVIRASDHPDAELIPIYAMTANAFRNDILEAELAGMNGHIAKPVDFDEAAGILQNIVKNKQMEEFSIWGGTKMTDYEILTKAGIDVSSLSKRLMGNISLIKIFVNKFISDNTYKELEAAIDNKDVKAAEIASHTLKGMCGNMSLTKLYELFTNQVNLIRSGDFDAAAALMSEISIVYKEAVVYMKEWQEA